MKVKNWAVVVLASGLIAQAMGQSPGVAIRVEPDELDRRQDLIGKDVVVDDHVKYYVPRNGMEPDELQLKRTPITFLVPRRLRPPASTRVTSVIVRGMLKREDGRLACAVTEITPVSPDLDRLDKGVAGLGAKDFETRKAWARWAERRAKDFKDKALLDRAKALEGDALRIEGEMKRLGVDAPREWLAMAQDARRRQVAEPEPSALAHRAGSGAMRYLAAATNAADLNRVIQEINDFFPMAAADTDSGRVNLARWLQSYADNPAGTYREVSAQAKKALDRRLWADANERLLDVQISPDLQTAVDVSERARSTVPERPKLPAQLLEKATRLARQDLGTLRLSEVKLLAEVYREKLQQPADALTVLSDWLKIQRDRLSSTDAEGPLELANLYEELLQDRVTSIELLRKAWRIDPTSKEIAEAFRTRGFRKVKDDWVESAPGGAGGSAPAVGSSRPAALGRSQGLIGLTADEVFAKIGAKPNRVSFVGSKGQLIEQRIYHIDTKLVRFVNLLHSPGELKPRVIADYTVSSSTRKGGLGLVR